MKQVQLLANNLVPLIPANPLVRKGYDTLFSDWLALFASRHTRRVYAHAIEEFFELLTEEGLTPEILAQFLLLESKQAHQLVKNYQGELVKKELAPATINRKLASLKSLVNYASSIGKCYYTLSEIKTITVTTYRDTTGIGSESFKLMLLQVERETLKGKRDYAILLLLWGNALRRSEITQCQISDFDPVEQKLWILGKGKKGQRQSVSLGSSTIEAISLWLEARNEVRTEVIRQGSEAVEARDDVSRKRSELAEVSSARASRPREGTSTKTVRGFSCVDEPLFCAVHKGYWGHRLNTDSIYKLVKKYAILAGIVKPLSPHRLRHSAITSALEATNGDVRSVQKLSRHSNLNTLMIYDDNRRNEQGRVTKLLEELL